MRIMILVKATADSEAGRMPTEGELAAMGAFNEELVKSGILLAGEGLKASSEGKRVTFFDGAPTVVDGPFAEAKELVSGFWMIDVNSIDEAISWAIRVPAPPKGAWELEVRPVFEMEDFGAEFTPEQREQEQRHRDTIEATS